MSRKLLGMVKRALLWAPEKAKLIAFKSLCLPRLEYASAAWDPHTKKHVDQLETVQDQAIRFIAKIEGRKGLDDARKRHGLQPLANRRKTRRINLLMRILPDEEAHPVLSSTCDELTRSQINSGQCKQDRKRENDRGQLVQATINTTKAFSQGQSET